ncbi:head maturation protease, ClpP-related [Nocardia sp. NPDC059240]|uniref:head maturation protease, ClpP-related n=1 Tax=Nocardia sp. NPDC059240 TaxID=3346786 RepID=UPI0036819FBC
MTDSRIHALRANGPSARRDWYRIENTATGVPEVFLYDEIDPYWGVSAESFARELAALDVDALTVRINSPGGSVFDGIAIMNSLRGHRARVTAVVDGLAASAASFIAMAADDIVMRPHAELMIHDAFGVCVGDANEMRDLAEQLDRVSNNIASMYAARAGGTAEQWRAHMHAETWYSAEEAVAAGLADRIEDAQPADAQTPGLAARFDLSIFNFAGRRAAPAPEIPSATPAEANRKRGMHMSFTADIATRLGLAEDADETAIRAALDTALASPRNIAPVELPFTDADIAFARAIVEHAPTLLDAANSAISDGKSTDLAALAQPIADSFQDTIDTANEALDAWGQAATADTPPAPAAAPAAPGNAAVALPAGVLAIDAATLSELQTRAARGDTARTEQERAERVAAVDNAVRTGRIAPSQREAWTNRLETDPAELVVLNALTPVHPIGPEIGHAATIHDDNSDDVYATLFGKDA